MIRGQTGFMRAVFSDVGSQEGHRMRPRLLAWRAEATKMRRTEETQPGYEAPTSAEVIRKDCEDKGAAA